MSALSVTSSTNKASAIVRPLLRPAKRPGRRNRRALAKPAKVAVVDIGSNSIHMVIARVGSGGFQILGRVKEMVGLGRGTLTRRRLSAKAMSSGLKTLARFKRRAERQGAEPILAVATSAVREAANGGAFVSRVRKELGLDIDVISGADEARLIFAAAHRALDFRGRCSLVVDIGGGSVELIQGAGGAIRWLESFELGVARMTERFIHSDPPRAEEIAALKAHARKLLAPAFARVRRTRPNLMVGTSGSILSLTAMAAALRTGAVPGKLRNHLLRREDLSALCKLVLARPAAKRARMRGLDRRRVDLAPAGAVLVELMMDGFGMRELRACDWALREGILLNLVERGGAGAASVRRAGSGEAA